MFASVPVVCVGALVSSGLWSWTVLRVCFAFLQFLVCFPRLFVCYIRAHLLVFCGVFVFVSVLFSFVGQNASNPVRHLTSERVYDAPEMGRTLMISLLLCLVQGDGQGERADLGEDPRFRPVRVPGIPPQHDRPSGEQGAGRVHGVQFRQTELVGVYEVLRSMYIKHTQESLQHFISEILECKNWRTRRHFVGSAGRVDHSFIAGLPGSVRPVVVSRCAIVVVVGGRHLVNSDCRICPRHRKKDKAF